MITENLVKTTIEAINFLYGKEINADIISIQKTRKEFEGDFTLVVFPLLKVSGKSPQDTANELGNYFVEKMTEVESFNVIKGFLNLVISSSYWVEFFSEISKNPSFGIREKNSSGKRILVEYSSPNTNKPLHLGHVRNNLLGYSVARILEARGHEVVKVNIVNDRGIHICKSMIAWTKKGNGETPESSGLKGDKLVGKYYVEFDRLYKEEIRELTESGMAKEKAEKEAPLMKEAQQMLLKWEAGDPEVIGLWKKMNGWVYKGFDVTYKNLGVNFDKIYYESETYLLGKEIVDDGLAKGVLERQDDTSVWIDLTAEGLDRKLLLRSDGTSVYMTQDLGTALSRYEEYGFSKMIYVVGNEQDYHFKVLSLILAKIGYSWAQNLFHLSYGMVELPAGKMKSREGTVVDADELMEGMIEEAREKSIEKGRQEDFSEEEFENLTRLIGMGALKYFILKVDPRKKMLFNPQESIDINGHTGPFIQYSFARIQSVLKKAGNESASNQFDVPQLQAKERELIRWLYDFPAVIAEAETGLNPAAIANYAYEIAKEFNQFYHDFPILKEENKEVVHFRIKLSEKIGNVIAHSMGLLGIEMPERM